jgi:hypothetical protein
MVLKNITLKFEEEEPLLKQESSRCRFIMNFIDFPNNYPEKIWKFEESKKINNNLPTKKIQGTKC